MYHLCFCLAGLALILPTTTEDKPVKEEIITGTIKKVDPSAHRLTVTVKGKDAKQPMDREFEVRETTKFLFQSGEEKQEALGKEAYKNARLKEGAEVTIRADQTGKATEVRVGAGPKPEKP